MICTQNRGKDKKRATSYLNNRSGTQFYHDWKPMRSIIDILPKNFQEDHTNSSRFPGVVDTLVQHTMSYDTNVQDTGLVP